MCALVLSLRFIVDFGTGNTTVQPNIPCLASPIAQSGSRSRGFSSSFSGDRPRERERDRERERERERVKSRDLSPLRSSGPPAPAAAFSRSAFIWAIWSLRSAELGLGARCSPPVWLAATISTITRKGQDAYRQDTGIKCRKLQGPPRLHVASS
jgi:hypothetical protein